MASAKIYVMTRAAVVLIVERGCANRRAEESEVAHVMVC
ncbi:hypothetical protein ACPOL_3288 [Acidisarcina polymorpha]|uniref:Uncharacterized protein n=1 Tax=Acidisarcina polymorpha TaxID=2211140 RepID=A0A2Z5G095_9BACT|nr:hypothetical protein ACPOL_3288 [Acidisarcina polymorpha]